VSESGDLPDEVARLLDAFVESLIALEILVAVSHEPERTWTADQIAAHLRIGGPAAERELAGLVSLGLLAQDDGEAPIYRFKPADSARAEAVERMTDCFRTHRISVINHVASRANQRIQALADAFRLKRKQ
jgi:DNA-binding IscR family transcriptional regulator